MTLWSKYYSVLERTLECPPGYSLIPPCDFLLVKWFIVGAKEECSRESCFHSSFLCSPFNFILSPIPNSLHPCFSRWGPWTSSITWEVVWNAEFQTPPQSCWIRIYILLTSIINTLKVEVLLCIQTMHWFSLIKLSSDLVLCSNYIFPVSCNQTSMCCFKYSTSFLFSPP